MNRIGKFIIFFVTCIFFTTILYSCSVDHILPKIEYSNRVSFKLAYLNYDDFLILSNKNRLFLHPNNRSTPFRFKGVSPTPFAIAPYS